MTNLFVSFYERYYLGAELPGLRFIPAPLNDLLAPGNEILESLEQTRSLNPDGRLLTVIHPKFIQNLKARLQDRKTEAS